MNALAAFFFGSNGRSESLVITMGLLWGGYGIAIWLRADCYAGSNLCSESLVVTMGLLWDCDGIAI